MTCSVTVSPDTDAEISAREIGSIYSATSFLRPARLFRQTFSAVRDVSSKSANRNVVAPTTTRRNVIKVNGRNQSEFDRVTNAVTFGRNIHRPSTFAPPVRKRSHHCQRNNSSRSTWETRYESILSLSLFLSLSLSFCHVHSRLSN